MPTFLEQEGSIRPISKILSCSLKMQVLSSQVRFGDRLFQIWEDWETDSVLNLESKEGSQETGKAKSWWRRRYYKCLRNIKPFSVPVSRSTVKSRRKSFTFLEKKKSRWVPIQFCTPPHCHSVFLLQHHHSSIGQRHMSLSRGDTTTVASLSLPRFSCWLLPKVEVSSEKGWNLALRGVSNSSKGWGTLLCKEQNPLPTMGSVRSLRDHRNSLAAFSERGTFSLTFDSSHNCFISE